MSASIASRSPAVRPMISASELGDVIELTWFITRDYTFHGPARRCRLLLNESPRIRPAHASGRTPAFAESPARAPGRRRRRQRLAGCLNPAVSLAADRALACRPGAGRSVPCARLSGLNSYL